MKIWLFTFFALLMLAIVSAGDNSKEELQDCKLCTGKSQEKECKCSAGHSLVISQIPKLKGRFAPAYCCRPDA
jgi:hypothetical protein